VKFFFNILGIWMVLILNELALAKLMFSIVDFQIKTVNFCEKT